MRDLKPYRTLFTATFKLSACTFGGGYIMVPLMRKRFVEELKWIDEREMLDLVAVAQSAPGPIAVNASLMIGYRMGGIAGALVAALGTVLPPLLIISLVSTLYGAFRDNPAVGAAMRGMQAGVSAVICSAVLDTGRSVLKYSRLFGGLVMAGVFLAVYCFKVNVIYVILICAALGYTAGILRGHAKACAAPAARRSEI